jgi:hemerythrin-like domain-containing protein
MNLVNLLQGEHASIRTAFDHVEKAAPMWSLSQIREGAAMLETLLMAHSTAEDRLLFDALPPKHEGVRSTLKAMREEHDRINGAFLEIREQKSIAESRRLLLRLVGHVREHFAVEERVLFSLAGETLGDAQLEVLGREYARRRGLGLSPD